MNYTEMVTGLTLKNTDKKLSEWTKEHIKKEPKMFYHIRNEIQDKIQSEVEISKKQLSIWRNIKDIVVKHENEYLYNTSMDFNLLEVVKTLFDKHSKPIHIEYGYKYQDYAARCKELYQESLDKWKQYGNYYFDNILPSDVQRLKDEIIECKDQDYTDSKRVDNSTTNVSSSIELANNIKIDFLNNIGNHILTELSTDNIIEWEKKNTDKFYVQDKLNPDYKNLEIKGIRENQEYDRIMKQSELLSSINSKIHSYNLLPIYEKQKKRDIISGINKEYNKLNDEVKRTFYFPFVVPNDTIDSNQNQKGKEDKPIWLEVGIKFATGEISLISSEVESKQSILALAKDKFSKYNTVSKKTQKKDNSARPYIKDTLSWFDITKTINIFKDKSKCVFNSKEKVEQIYKSCNQEDLCKNFLIIYNRPFD